MKAISKIVEENLANHCHGTCFNPYIDLFNLQIEHFPLQGTPEGKTYKLPNRGHYGKKYLNIKLV